MSIQDVLCRKRFFDKCVSAASFVAFEDYDAALKERALRPYAILASYLRGRPLKLLRANTNGEKPRSKPRALAATSLSASTFTSQRIFVGVHPELRASCR